MKKVTTTIQGLYLIDSNTHEDNRGIFVKTFNTMEFQELELENNFPESFYTISKKNVLRGMHFQLPPFDHIKVVYVSRGAIRDVVLDLRIGSETYGKYEVFELNEKNLNLLYLPKGIAHGFLSLEDNTTTNYLISTMHSKEHDSGIHFNSFQYNWNARNPILSEKDSKLIPLTKFKSPFIFTGN